MTNIWSTVVSVGFFLIEENWTKIDYHFTDWYKSRQKQYDDGNEFYRVTDIGFKIRKWKECYAKV